MFTDLKRACETADHDILISNIPGIHLIGLNHISITVSKYVLLMAHFLKSCGVPQGTRSFSNDDSDGKENGT